MESLLMLPILIPLRMVRAILLELPDIIPIIKDTSKLFLSIKLILKWRSLSTPLLYQLKQIRRSSNPISQAFSQTVVVTILITLLSLLATPLNMSLSKIPGVLHGVNTVSLNLHGLLMLVAL